MRFCLVSTQAHWGGGEALLFWLAGELSRKGHDVSWIVRSSSEVEQRVAQSGADILHATRKRGVNLSDWRISRRVLRGWRPDVVVLNDTHAVPLVGTAALACGRPRPLRLAYKHTVFPLRSPLKYRLLCDKLVCVSAAARQTVIDGGLAATHTAVVHGGCEPIWPSEDARRDVRRELGLQDHQRLLVCVGSLLECKGHLDLVTAMKKIAAEQPHVVAAIAGEGPQRSALQRKIDQLGLSRQVRLLGYRSDATRWLDGADIVVHPSHAEGLSLVLIQAQMLCKPIVATWVGGTTEVLAADAQQGCTAWIAKPQDPASLQAQITAALHASANPTADWRERLQITAERMRSDFTIQASAEKLVHLAAELLAKRKNR